jgi:glycosyltransferase involved in cell wall biosynthesis
MLVSAPTPTIGYVLKRYPRYSETFVVNEILELERSGARLHIFSLRHPEDGHFQDAISRVRAPVTYLASTGLKVAELWAALNRVREAVPGAWSAIERLHALEARHLYQALRLVEEGERLGVTHFHAHFATEATAIARAASIISGHPYSFTAHAKDIFHESVDRADLTRKIGDASAVVTVSDFNRLFLRRRSAAHADSIVRIYNGLDLTRFRYADPTERSPFVLAIGRLVPKKGFEDLIEACAILRDRKRGFRCAIVGMGLLEAELRERIRSHGLEGIVRLVGARPQEEIVEWIQKAAVLAAPCVEAEDGNRDGLPTVLLEAMALGTPCVSTDVTGIPEALIHDKTGLAVAQRDPAGLADALDRLMNDGALRARLAREARAHVECEFDAAKNVAQLRALFDRSASEPRALAGGR